MFFFIKEKNNKREGKERVRSELDNGSELRCGELRQRAAGGVSCGRAAASCGSELGGGELRKSGSERRGGELRKCGIELESAEER